MNLKSLFLNRRTFVTTFVLGFFLFIGWAVCKLQSEQTGATQELIRVKSDLKDLTEMNAKLKNKVIQLNKDYEGLSAERDNLINRAKDLIAQSNKAVELELDLKKITGETKLLKEKHKKTVEENMAYKNRINKLKDAKEELLKEKLKVEAELLRERDGSWVVVLEKEKNELEEQKKKLVKVLDEANESNHNLEAMVAGLKDELDILSSDSKEARGRISKLNKQYADAVEKNKALEKEVVGLPRKFKEISRQNKVLKKQTANMHYNLGVFYTKHQKYSRAIAEFEKAIHINPNDAYAHFNLGFIYAEFVVSRAKAVKYFKEYLRLAKDNDKDADWVKKYLLTWETWDGKKPMD